MPLLATLIGHAAAGIASMLSLVMGYKLALKLAAYTVWLAVTGAFLTSTIICMRSLWMMAAAYFSTGGGTASIMGAIAMGLSIIIPSNAATVLACCSSVWIAASVYKMQKIGIVHFGS